MNGIGLYTFADGRTFLGEYKDNQKMGYGIFNLPDGCLHLGYWKNGKGNGLGTFQKARHQIKYAFWEDGPQTKNFDAKTVNKIKLGKIDYRTFFKKEENKKMEKVQSFEMPE